MRKSNLLLDPVTKLELKDELERIVRQIDGKNRGYRDEILTKLDTVVGELTTAREERTIQNYHVRQVRSTTENHEKRISKLEKSAKN